MIKRSTQPGTVEIISYVCDGCIKEMPGEPIMVYYPYSHLNDSLDGPSHFCSDKCLREFEDKLIKKYGNWKSESRTPEQKVRSSAEWRAERVKRTEPPKARRVSRKPRRNQKPKRQEQEQEPNE